MTKHWIENLPEVGMHYKYMATAIKTKKSALEQARNKVKNLEYELSRLEREAEEEVLNEWTLDEVTEAKNQTHAI